MIADSGGYALLLGSGDREKPRVNDGSVTNHFFMVKDKPSDSAWLSAESGTCGSAVLCLNSLLSIATSATPTAADLAPKKGWYLGLNANEKVVTSAITIFGTVTFSTHQSTTPIPGSCSSNLGTARVYNISFTNAESLNGTVNRAIALPPNIGLPPSPVGGMVTLDNGKTVPFCIGCNSDSPLEGNQPAMPAGVGTTQPKGRVYWYVER